MENGKVVRESKIIARNEFKTLLVVILTSITMVIEVISGYVTSSADSNTVVICADKRKAQLIAKGSIDSSWASLKHSAIEQIDGKKGKEWKIFYKNPTAKDKTKETLYMFFSLSGNFIASNFSGK